MSFSPERRRLLKLLGLGTAAAMPAYRPGRLVAAAEAARPRFFAALSFNGVVRATFWPDDERVPAFRVATQPVTTLLDTRLPLQASLKPLEPFRPKMLLIKGLDNGASGLKKIQHTEVTAYSGMPPSGGDSYTHAAMTIDQAIAGKIGGDTKFRSLQFSAVMHGTSAFAAGPGPGLAPMRSPGDAFARVFGGFTGGGADPGRPATAAEMESLRRRKLSILDRVSKDLGAISARLGGSDLQRLQAHTSAIRDLERRLTATSSGGGASCVKPPVSYAGPACSGRDGDLGCPTLPEISKLHMEIAAAAFACGLTRVASMQWGGHTSGIRYDYALPPELRPFAVEGHHAISHMDANNPNGAPEKILTTIVALHQQLMAHLYAKLDSYTDVDGRSLLDNTVVMWTNEVGNGAHSVRDVPVTLVGGAGLGIKTGRFLNYNAPAAGGSRNVNDLLSALGNLFGLGLETFGLRDLCKSPLGLA